MSEQIAVRLPEEELEKLDRLVELGRFPSRAAAVRAALELMFRIEREREIAEEYRRGYGAFPQEEWIGQAGLALAAQFLADEAEDRV